MALRNYVPQEDPLPAGTKPLSVLIKTQGPPEIVEMVPRRIKDTSVNIDLTEVYFLIMHFLSSGPCQRTCEQLWNELLEHQLLPRRYHGWYSRSGQHCGDADDDGLSFPLNYSQLTERYRHIQNDHLVQLLKQLLCNRMSRSGSMKNMKFPNAAHVPTLLGLGSFSLLNDDGDDKKGRESHPPTYLRWPHMRSDLVHGLHLREIGGGFLRHHRSPSIRAACHTIAKPATLVQRMENVKKLRGHRNAVYCVTYDRSGRYVISGSDDRLVKIWSMETAFCLASCRGHEGDITDLAVSYNNAVVASASNDFVIRVWRIPDGMPVSVLRGHTAAVTAIEFCPRPGSLHQLLSSSDDGTCRIWDARGSHVSPRIFSPRPPDNMTGRIDATSTNSNSHGHHQIFCCAFNSSGTVFVTGSSDNLARVWNACKSGTEDANQANHEMDILVGHENDVNYVQFSGCGVASRMPLTDGAKEEIVSKFRNLWFSHDNIVTCSRDGSATIWTPKSRRSHGKTRWVRQYHLRVPPPPTAPQPPRGPRQRVLPTPRGVNMIVWSLDNRFVLAAIMDCRICVWNAADSSVVHTLTGHTAFAYVLDVHPFNPRIAMSAGYDGKTIVWDIWEGKPIRIYEISPFKLVDGKFSPDGTSIILSDEVGQLHILSTGQGESQNDAKYDQFFLGDYRPLIQDSHGNVIDQETQLMPFRRNMQDLLCDSGMIPYEEPYQSTFQKRRLGALGLEWKPSSLKLSSGPDFSLDPEFQLLPLADLDFIVELMPEFVDAMDWEPDIEVRSDDTDSEYNVTEGYSSGGEPGSLNSGFSYESECSEDSEVGINDDSRRSRRKKNKNDVELMTSSGRRVKRRNLEDCGHPVRKNRPKNIRVGKKSLKGKSSKRKALRPQRAAARNALNLFSKITGTSVDVEGDDVSEIDLSESESSMQDEDFDSDEFDEAFENERQRHLKGKEVAVDEPQGLINSAGNHNSHGGTRKRLILKLPVRDTNKVVISQSINENDSSMMDHVVGSSSKASPVTNGLTSALLGSSGDDTQNLLLDERNCVDRAEKFDTIKYEDIKWGGVRTRSSKRRRLEVGVLSARFSLSKPCERISKDSLQAENDHIFLSQYVDEDTNGSDEYAGKDSRVEVDRQNIGNGCLIGRESPILLEPETGVTVPHVVTRLKIKSRNMPTDNLENQNRNVLLSPTKFDDHIICDRWSLEAERDKPSESFGDSPIGFDENGSTTFNGHSSKMYNVVYKRSKICRNRENMESDCVARESNSNASNCSRDSIPDFNDGEMDQPGRLQSMRYEFLSNGADVLNSSIKLRKGVDPAQELNSPSNGFERSQLQHDDWGSSSRMTVGLRSNRSRRTSYHFPDASPVDRKKLHQPSKGGSWLMLLAHEEGSRYIPQLGDEVAYLRQGHQEYLEFSCLKELGPWKWMKAPLRAVEFCRVIKLEYSTLAGSGDSCCKMTLQFVDQTSAVFQKTFKLTLPEVTGFPDFLVERSRYDAALQRNWACRDKCRVWWKNEGEEDGDWWNGRVMSIDPKTPEFPDSPWERYTIWYSSDPKEKHKHSPWELFDTDDASRWEQPTIAKDVRDKLLSAFAKLERSGSKSQDQYAVQKLRQVSQKPNFVNRFPVPFSLDVIHTRIKNCYYRSIEALEHDIEIMLSNAESYFAKNAEMLTKVQRMSEFLGRTLSTL